MTYFKRIRKALPAVAAAAMMVLTTNSCERRELYVYQDSFRQVLLEIDWRDYDRDKTLYPHTPDPGGMTVWFYPADGSKADHYTTAQVTRYETYLSKGQYEALVIDYSPEEYGRQEFIGMDYASTALVQSKRSDYQYDDYAPLYDDRCYAKQLKQKEPTTGFWSIYNQPEKMASDTTMMDILTGKYNHYIPYDERDTYQSTLIQQVFKMNPLIIPWKMRIRIPIKGIYYLYQTRGSVAGLADGYFLAKDHPSDDACLHAVDDWEVHVTGDNEGYIAQTFDTWGMRNAIWAAPRLRDKPYRIDAAKDEVRLNLAVKLRDRKTVVYFHFDIGHLVDVFSNEYALSVDLREALAEDQMPVLPYVDGVNGIEFGGVVVPWEEIIQRDVPL